MTRLLCFLLASGVATWACSTQSQPGYEIRPEFVPSVPDRSYRAIPASDVGPEQTGGSLHIVRGRGGIGVYEVYVDLDGGVRRVDVVESVREADEGIVDSLKHWRFRPRSDRVRFLMRFDLRR